MVTLGVVYSTIEEFNAKNDIVLAAWVALHQNDTPVSYALPLEQKEGGYWMQVLPEVADLFENENLVPYEPVSTNIN